MTIAILIALAVGLCGFVALPLLYPKHADPLPDYSDPVLRELQEERDALFRAIRELEAREDLAPSRRSELRARYEAKAAGVLRAIDEREVEIGRGASAPRQPRDRHGRVPYGALALVGLAVVTAASLSEFVFPRVSQDQTVTTASADQLAASEQLRDLQRAAERDPSTANLLALADAYWRLQDAGQAEEAYRRVLETAEPVPAVVFRRLGFLALQNDLEEAAALLEQARAAEPGDPETLFTLAEVQLALGRFDDARTGFAAYLETPEGAGDEAAEARLELIEAVAPLAAAVEDEPSEENLLALADAYWQRGMQQQAVSAYFRVLTEVSPDSIPALTRTAEALFLSGRPADAAQLYERARALAAARGAELDARSLLLLGNARFAEDEFEAAIEAWEAHLEIADAPGRVPDLIASARARLSGGADAGGAPADAANAVGGASAEAGAAGSGAAEGGGASGAGASDAVLAQQLYTANCATCHGAGGQGGFGPALVGNPRAQDAGNVASVVRFGRGSMPGFGAVLSEGNLELLVDWVTEELSRTADGAR